MRIKNATCAFIYRSVLAILGTVVLLHQTGIFFGEFRPYFFCFFTNISNIGVVVCLFGEAIFMLRNRVEGRLDSSVVWAPNFKYAMVMAISVTGFIAHFMLGYLLFAGGTLNIPLLILHYVMPIGMVFDWLLFDEKGHMGKFGPFVWVVFPLVYLAYVMVFVNVFGISMGAPDLGPSRFPYPFIDIDVISIGSAVTNCAVMLVAFIALGYVYYAIDHALAKHASRVA
jgi:hypothetical protein